LVIAPKHRQVVEQHARAIYPKECCGVLIGRFLKPDGSEVQVDHLLAARNDRSGEAGRHQYEIPAQTVISAHRHARKRGLDVVGYYHSHPDYPARPSEADREHAWARLSYLIVSVRDGQPHSVRSWRLSEDRRQFEEQTVDGPPLPLPATISQRGRAALL
jgi:proteasome lid subunit RPN8/RPN11